MNLLLGVIIGIVLFEIYNYVYAKNDIKKCIPPILILILIYFLFHVINH